MTAVSRIMVTGATGFVGKSLLPHLARSWPQATILGCGKNDDTALDQVGYCDIDVCTSALIDVVADFKPSHIIHLAARSSVAAALNEAKETSDVSVIGAVNLSDAVRLHVPTSTILFASSGEVYGKAFLADAPLDETSPIAPTNPYARSKVAAEMILTDRIGPDATLIIARPLNHTGPGQDSRFVVPSFALQIAEIEFGLRDPVVQVGNLQALRDFLAIDDVVAAYVALLGIPMSSAGPHIFNISSQTLRSIDSILETLCAMSTHQCSVEIDPSRLRPIEVAKTCLSSAKLRDLTGWAPVVPWTDVLLQVLENARHRVAAGMA